LVLVCVALFAEMYFFDISCAINKFEHAFVDFCSKNVPDYSAARMMNDLGFISFDLSAGTESVS